MEDRFNQSASKVCLAFPKRFPLAFYQVNAKRSGNIWSFRLASPKIGCKKKTKSFSSSDVKDCENILHLTRLIYLFTLQIFVLFFSIFNPSNVGQTN